MATDWDWKYLEWGTAASLTIGSPAGAHDLTAIDHTAGVAVLGGTQTVEPQATVRAAELADLGLAPDDLDDATLTLNGNDWRITSYRPLPTTQGEPDGEYLLMLEAE